jgi:dienelactone hydrolase
MRRWVLGLVAIVQVAGCAPGLHAVKTALGPGDAGTVWFATDERDVLNGHLTLPSGAGPFPAIILMHGCSGLPSRAIGGWEPELRRWGYATFVVDSFRGRGLREVCSDALALTGNRRIADAYGALRILATHPGIDGDRVALMGFSHGGIATLGAGTEWARLTYGPSARATFRAFFPFYPYCNAEAPELDWGVAGPVRIHIGALDDWTPARTCEALVARGRRVGFDIAITVYPDALHSFDSIGAGPERLPNADNAADCTPRLASMRGPILNLFELRRCVRKGATIGWNPQATEQARRNVREQLAQLVSRPRAALAGEGD